MIGIIDYGSGNLRVFVNVYKSLGRDLIIINNPEDLKRCTHIIMPGVSAWDTTLKSIEYFREELYKCIIENKIPFLGVCVAMQILATNGEEGKQNGMDWIRGIVKKLPTNEVDDLYVGPKLPHMGWNVVIHDNKSDLMKGMPENPEFYFLHSYYFHCFNSDNVIASVKHNSFKFPVIVKNENIYGIQFHPEKSHKNGKLILDNFAKL